MPQQHNINSILFDLDGTLIDTAPDMAAALNVQREKHGLAPLPFSAIRNQVSNGALALVKLGFGEQSAARYDALREEYLAIYEQQLCIDSALFNGMADILAAIEAQSLCWGIVTNKPGWLAEPLLAQLKLQQRAACIVCGDTLPQRKPHPAPILYACKQIDRASYNCVYIGDGERDITAGRAAGMRTVVANYGYIDTSEQPHNWGADAIADNVTELADWLYRHTQLNQATKA